ncbi:MAG: ParB N-terminal domain-containing protein [archaeon GB-1867-005]|nr:ParB N-terminal domain-containing protein [Candidatus Culexmicrobium cathedralense]
MSSRVLELQHRGFRVKLKLEFLSDLHIHEEIIPSSLKSLMRKMSREGLLRDPVIVDEKSLVVLDGMHRVEALKRLGCRLIATCLVDYGDPRVLVQSWWRAIEGDEVKLASLVKRLDCFEVSSIDLDAHKNRVPLLIFRGRVFALGSRSQSLYEMLFEVKRLEEILKREGFKVSYETEFDAMNLLKSGACSAVICIPCISKEKVVELALSGKVLPHKSTRHVIPLRPLSVNVPLSLLKCEDAVEANRIFIDSLKGRKRKLLPPQVFMGRRYEEYICVFEGVSA